MHEALFFKKLDNARVQCTLCPRMCIMVDGAVGACGVRKNEGGTLFSLVYGKPCSLAVDPVEKKPLYHFFPGEQIFSLATVGCNLFCRWCQNHEISHPHRIIAPFGDVSPEQVVERCQEAGCSLVAFTYTEPTIFYEYMLDIAKLAQKKGIKTVMVSNGYIEPAPLKKLSPYLDAANIDLKAFDDKSYLKGCSASLAPVLRTLAALQKQGVHLEVTTLIVPGINDEVEQLEALYTWVAEHLGRDQVVHLSRFFPDHQTLNKEPTPLATLAEAERIAKQHLRYVYVGNVPQRSDTTCPACGKKVIVRGNSIRTHLQEGSCPCGERIPGVFSSGQTRDFPKKKKTII